MKKTIKYLLFGLVILVFNFIIFLGPYTWGYSLLTSLVVKEGFIRSGWFRLIIAILTIAFIMFYYFYFLNNINRVAKCYKYFFVILMTLVSTIFPVLVIMSIYKDSVPSIFFNDTYEKIKVYLETREEKFPTYNDVIAPTVVTFILNWFGVLLVQHCPNCHMIGFDAVEETNRQESHLTTHYDTTRPVYTGTTHQTAHVTLSDGTSGDITISEKHYENKTFSGTSRRIVVTYTQVCKYCGFSKECSEEKKVK